MVERECDLGPGLLAVFILGNGLFILFTVHAFLPERGVRAARAPVFAATRPGARSRADAAGSSFLPSRMLILQDGPLRVPEPAASSARGTSVPGRSPAGGERVRDAASGAGLRAESAYAALLRSPRYRRSPVIQAWTRDFLSHADLRAINERYLRERDVARFLIDTASSPNFQALAVRYLQDREIWRFLKELAVRPEIEEISPELLENPALRGAARTLEQAGILSDGVL